MAHRPVDYFDAGDLEELQQLYDLLLGIKRQMEEDENYEAACCVTDWLGEISTRIAELVEPRLH
jgi:hypothetical protein